VPRCSAAHAALIAARGDTRQLPPAPVQRRCNAAQDALNAMAADGVAPDAIAYEALLTVFARAKQPDRVATALLDMASARVPLTAACYAIALRALAAGGRLRPALALLAEWRAAAAESNAVPPPGADAFEAALQACASSPDAGACAAAWASNSASSAAADSAMCAAEPASTLQLAWDLAAEMEAAGVPRHRNAFHALMDAALACRAPAAVFDARAAMEAAGIRATDATWCRLVAAAALRPRSGVAETLAVIEEMQREGFTPTEGIFTSLLAACARCGDAPRAEAAAAAAAAAGIELGAVALASRLRASGGAGAWRHAAALLRAAPPRLARDRKVLMAALDACMGPGGAPAAVAAGARPPPPLTPAAAALAALDAQLARMQADADANDDAEALADADTAAAAIAAMTAAAAASAGARPGSAPASALASASCASPSLLASAGPREAVALLRWGWAYGVVPTEGAKPNTPAAAATGWRTRLMLTLTRTETVVATLAALQDAAAAGAPQEGLLLVTGAEGGVDAAAKRAWAVQRTLEREGITWAPPPPEAKLRGAAVAPADLARWAARLRAAQHAAAQEEAAEAARLAAEEAGALAAAALAA
jgi:hypothetical protein